MEEIAAPPPPLPVPTPPPSSSSSSSPSWGLFGSEADDGATGLLLGAKGSDVEAGGGDGGGGASEREKMLPRLVALAWPVVLAYLLEMFIPLVSLTVLGHVDVDVLAGAALAIMFANITGLCVCFGLATALDTLCSQAVGADAHHLVGVQAQRGAAILLTAAAIIIATLWLNAAAILTAAGQSPPIAAIAGTYIRCLIPMLPAMCLLEVLKKVCYALQVVRPQLVVLLVVNTLNATAQVLAVHVFGLPYLAVPIITSISTTAAVCALAAYMVCSGRFARVWTGFSAAAFSGWPAFLRLGIPGLFMLSTEWWAFEVLALEAGILGTHELAAQVVVLNVASLAFMIPLGQSVAVSVLVGNFLGAARPDFAARAARLAMCTVLCTAAVVGTILIAARKPIASMYSNDVRVVTVAARSLVVVGIFQLFDGIQAVCSGAIRGSGRQIVGAVGNLTGYILIGLPLSALFAFHFRLSVEGLWIAMTIGLFITSSSYTVVILRQDWAALAARAAARTAAQSRAAADPPADTPASLANTLHLDDTDDDITTLPLLDLVDP